MGGIGKCCRTRGFYRWVVGGIHSKPHKFIILTKLNGIRKIQKKYEYVVMEAENAKSNIIDFKI